MLRRVIVPFVELFFILLLMFIALYFVTASLTGEGDTRAQDELHSLEIELKTSWLVWEIWAGKLPEYPSDGNFTYQFPSGSYRALGFTVEAASLEPYLESVGWDVGWSAIGNGDWIYQDRPSIYSDGVCVPFEEKRWFIRKGGSHQKRPSAETGNEPSMPRLEAIASGSPSADFTAIVEEIRASDTISWKLKVLFQPKEIGRDTIVRVGIPVLPIPESSKLSSGSIRFEHEVLTTGKRVNGELVVSRFSNDQAYANLDYNEVALGVVKGEGEKFIQDMNSFFKVDLNMNSGSLNTGGDIPVIFDLPDCRPFPRVYLYSILSPSGVELSLESPEQRQ